MPTESAALPSVREWTLRNPRSEETRRYTQQALTIESESRLLTLVHDTAAVLNEDGFPWDTVSALFDQTRDIDWMAAAELLGIIGARVPTAFGELASIFLSVYPTNEDGSRNAAYEADVRFLRSSISFTMVVDMVKTFVEQNDYQRLADPIGAILGQAARTGMAPKEPTNSNSTSDGAETSGAS